VLLQAPRGAYIFVGDRRDRSRGVPLRGTGGTLPAFPQFWGARTAGGARGLGPSGPLKTVFYAVYPCWLSIQVPS